MALVNSWLLYKRDFIASETEGKSLNLYDFKANVSCCLRNQHKPLVRGPGRPSTSGNRDNRGPRKAGRRPRKLPPKAVIQDTVDDLPVGLPKRANCKMDGCNSRSIFYCMKCKLYLCISKKNNCFAKFHGAIVNPMDLPQ